jgi:hypothetical protein
MATFTLELQRRPLGPAGLPAFRAPRGDFSASMANRAVGIEVLVVGPHGEAIDGAHARRVRMLLAAALLRQHAPASQAEGFE